jgi:hypothetical protein
MSIEEFKVNSGGTLQIEVMSPNNSKVTFIPPDDHPWLFNLRDMMKMLDDEIKIPHKTYFDLYDYSLENLPCNECTRAYELRSQYLQAKQRGIQ